VAEQQKLHLLLNFAQTTNDESVLASLTMQQFPQWQRYRGLEPGGAQALPHLDSRGAKAKYPQKYRDIGLKYIPN